MAKVFLLTNRKPNAGSGKPIVREWRRQCRPIADFRTCPADGRQGRRLPCAVRMWSAPVMVAGGFQAHLCGCVCVGLFGAFAPDFGGVPRPVKTERLSSITSTAPPIAQPIVVLLTRLMVLPLGGIVIWGCHVACAPCLSRNNVTGFAQFMQTAQGRAGARRIRRKFRRHTKRPASFPAPHYCWGRL